MKRNSFLCAATATGIAVIAWASCDNFRQAQGRARVSRVRVAFECLMPALALYYSDHSAYPPGTTGNEPIGDARFGTPELPRLPTYRHEQRREPLPQSGNPPFRFYICCSGRPVYHSVNRDGVQGFILVDNGPDEDNDILPVSIFDPATTQPCLAILNQTYDPTNGAFSSGDLWQMGVRRAGKPLVIHTPYPRYQLPGNPKDHLTGLRH